MANIALTGCIWEYGGFPSASSIAVTPSDQISVKWLYLFFEITSGDIYTGVPITVPLSAFVYINYAATPKSAILIVPFSSNKMFPAFISLWIFLLACKYSIPNNTWYNIAAISDSVSDL